MPNTPGYIIDLGTEMTDDTKYNRVLGKGTGSLEIFSHATVQHTRQSESNPRARRPVELNFNYWMYMIKEVEHRHRVPQHNRNNLSSADVAELELDHPRATISQTLIDTYESDN